MQLPTLRGGRVRSRWTEESGAAMVEFAIIAPLLFILIFGIIDYGRFFFDYNQLTNAAREGARWGAVQPIRASLPLEIQDLVKSRVTDARINASSVVITATIPAASGGSVETVKVSIAGYPFSGMSPIIKLPNRLPTVTAEFRHELR